MTLVGTSLRRFAVAGVRERLVDVATAPAAWFVRGDVMVRFSSSNVSRLGGAHEAARLHCSSRPGGHVTGITFVSNVLGAKRVQLLHDLMPNVTRIALLMNPDNPNTAAEQADSQAGAAKFGHQTVVLSARNASEIDTAFAELVRAKADALISGTDPVLLDRR